MYDQSPTTLLLIGTTLLAFVFFLWGINSWKFAFAGDEWVFYNYAKYLATSPHIVNPLSFNGVIHTHSPLASLYQALFMVLLGPTNFAWRLSNVILIFPLSFFFYRWLRLSFPKEIAVLSTILLQTSFYLANFFKIGYDNPQSLTLFVICLYLVTLFGKKPTKKIGLWMGITLGVSFYIYLGPLFPLFLWPFLLPLRNHLQQKPIQKILGLLIGTYVLLLIPLLFQISSLHRILIALGQPNKFGLNPTVWRDFLLFYQNHDAFYDHFVVGPYLDRITELFCFIGSVIVLFNVKQRAYLLLLLSYLSTVIVIGSTSPDWASPITRGIFFLPYGFVFAGIGLSFVYKKMKHETLALTGCWVIILMIVTLNAYQSQIGVFTDKNSAGYTGMALIIKSLEEAQTAHESILIVISPSLRINYYIWNLPSMVQAYDLGVVRYRIIQPSELSCPTNKTTILFFQRDSEAKKEIMQLKCGKTMYHTTMLSPDTKYY